MLKILKPTLLALFLSCSAIANADNGTPPPPPPPPPPPSPDLLNVGLFPFPIDIEFEALCIVTIKCETTKHCNLIGTPRCLDTFTNLPVEPLPEK